MRGRAVPAPIRDGEESPVEIATLRELRADLDEFLARFAGCFRSIEAKQHLATYVGGQLGPLQRKSVEPIALEAGRAATHAAAVPRAPLVGREGHGSHSPVCQIVAQEHGDPDAIGVIDGTDHPKKGDKTVGIQRQYCGRLGKIENCVATVNLDDVGHEGFHTLVDADLYLPEGWAEDLGRCEAAGIPSNVGYRAKWRIALALIARSLGDGVPLRWITADEDYGRIPEFLKGVEQLGRL
ncbi:MAG: transposase [Planctomycetota bacterium]